MHIELSEKILGANEVTARRLQMEWDAAGVKSVNLLSAPGSGKTALLEAILPRITKPVAVLEGDLQTDRDAQRLRRLGIEAVQITTGGTCHLEAEMVERAWRSLKTPLQGGLLFIENVGNLVCPASYQLGEHLRVVLLSVTEGDDKPAKYPKAFRTSQAMVVSKADLLPHMTFDIDRAVADARAIQPDLHCFVLSSRTGEGVDSFLAWLLD